MNIATTQRQVFQILLTIFLLLTVSLSGCGRANQVDTEATWPIPNCRIPQPVVNLMRTWLRSTVMIQIDWPHLSPITFPQSGRMAVISTTVNARWPSFTRPATANLYEVTDSQAMSVTVIAQLRLTQEWRRMTIFVEETDPHLISGIMIQPVDVPADVVVAAQNPQSLEEQIDLYIQNLVAADRFSGVVLVANAGEPIFEEAYGLANQEAQIPNGIDTRFGSASVGKMFTAVAIVQLAEAGKLNYTDPMSRYLPDYPAAVADQVTIDQLLTHRSGIPDFFEEWARFQQVQVSTDPQRDYLSLFMHEPLHFTPGERFEYSNSNYILLGAIIEQVSGLSYAAYLQTHIFDPAGMTATTLSAAGIDEQLLAQNYTEFDENLQPVDGPRQLATVFQGAVGSAAGGGYTTVGDLLKFDQALRTHKLLSPEGTEVLLTDRVDYERPGYRYAYGFIVREQAGEAFVGHSGGSHGVDAQFEMDRTHGYTVIILANYELVAEPILIHIEQLLHSSQ
ncbi:MAG: serine hydrolase domain-containing protein [Caldilineaceae bacterium]